MSKAKTKQELKLEKEENERAYTQALKSFKHRLADAIQMTKEELESLARKLEKAGTVKADRICQRIIDDLEYEISNEHISDKFIWDSLPTKYKQSALGSRRWSEWKGRNLTKQLYAVLQDWTRLGHSDIVSATVENVVKDSRDFRYRTLQKMNDTQIDMTLTAARYLTSVMEDLGRTGREIREQRKSEEH